MKKWFWTLTVLAALASFAAGCENKKSDNKNQSYGYYDPVTGQYYDSRYPSYGYSVNPDAVLLSGKVEITDAGAYRDYLKGIGFCLSFWSQTCSWVDESPGMTIQVNDYKFRSTNNTSPGSVIVHTQSGPANYNVTWRMFSGGTGFDSQQTQPFGTYGYNTYIKIKVTGRSTDSTVLVELMYGDKSFGYGYLDRINR